MGPRRASRPYLENCSKNPTRPWRKVSKISDSACWKRGLRFRFESLRVKVPSPTGEPVGCDQNQILCVLRASKSLNTEAREDLSDLWCFRAPRTQRKNFALPHEVANWS
jgi:hypothetical protein